MGAKLLDTPPNSSGTPVPFRRPSMVTPPGVWFQAVTVVCMTDAWIPAVGRMLHIEKMATLASSPKCSRCQRRKNMMNRCGWRGLPRLLLSREFWRDSRRKEDVAWQKKTESASPTTITS